MTEWLSLSLFTFSLNALYTEDFISFVQYSFIDLKSICLVGDTDKVIFSLYSASDMDESSLGFHDTTVSVYASCLELPPLSALHDHSSLSSN